MKVVANKLFQIIMDLIVGLAIYFGMKAFMPSIATNNLIVITLIITAVFSEFVEVRFKKD